MFGFGKLKEKQSARMQAENQSAYLVDQCVEKGFMPLKEVNNGLPVLLKFENVPLYEVKASRAYASVRVGKGRIGQSRAVEGWNLTDSGILSITTNGIFFYGNKTTINLQRTKVLNVEMVIPQKKNDISGIKVHVSNRNKPVIFGINLNHKNGHKIRTLKQTKLKEMYIVRYADDFKVFTNSHKSAIKIYHAVRGYLKNQLNLDISCEKSTITNLRRKASEFLGFSLKAVMKRNKFVANTHVSEKKLKSIINETRQLIRKIQKNPIRKIIDQYNASILGRKNYY
ncbi:reverse transcriptase domain-containing protein [Neobacillus pocheonensis]|uniref:Reverse transcriptase domain-containing protein n=1 Tax=Neobacillus pocheonensis TaxID=363869 RepID=A0ABT0WA15_9BACI|nr:reverse transcriptase domain-containing protein [Neobacillus pocheonensis]